MRLGQFTNNKDGLYQCHPHEVGLSGEHQRAKVVRMKWDGLKNDRSNKDDEDAICWSVSWVAD